MSRSGRYRIHKSYENCESSEGSESYRQTEREREREQQEHRAPTFRTHVQDWPRNILRPAKELNRSEAKKRSLSMGCECLVEWKNYIKSDCILDFDLPKSN